MALGAHSIYVYGLLEERLWRSVPVLMEIVL